MWTKEEIESWIFDKFEYVETVFIEYFRLLIGICFHPNKSLKRIHNNEVISPFVFFFMNLFFTGILENFGNLKEFIDKLLKSLVLTSKPTFDEAFYSMIGLLSGTLLFIFLFRLISGRIIKQKLSYSCITKPILYASFLFVPIVILNNLISSFIMSQLLQLFGGNSNFSAFSLITFLLFIIIFGWWSYIVYIGLNINFDGDVNVKYGRSIIYTMLFLGIFSILTSNIENIEKISSLRYLANYKKTADEALAKNPQDFFTAGTATFLISSSKWLNPFRRYCEKMRSIVYFSTLINGFNLNYSITKLNNGQFEEVEKYYTKVIDTVAAAPHTSDEHKFLKKIRDILIEAAKDKHDEKYVYGVYENSFGVSFGFSTSNRGIRIIP